MSALELVLPSIPPDSAPESTRRSVGSSREDEREREIFRLVCQHMRRLAGPHRDFDDLVQTGIVETWRSLPRFRGDAQLGTFVGAVCYRVWAKHLRFTSRFLRRITWSRSGDPPDSIDERASAPETLLARERWQRLYVGLEQLRPKRRAVVVLHDLEGLTIEEIATIVGAGEATVRTRLRDGRKALRRALSSDPYFHEGVDR